ncbi:MAG: trypsin-like peptidase domain-containing protein [Archangiaceae bacterium]|nr:trypsin-like peptidase domain-containing protein [Archangiaceae bacterium]
MSPAIADLDERRTLEPGPVWVMTLTGSWASGPLRGVGFTASNGSGRLRGGMSGSPVFDERGRVVGLACIGQSNSLCGIVTLLKRSLPGWVTDRLMLAAART